MAKYAIHLCSHTSADHLVGKARTYAAVKAAVLKAGRFSVFEATASRKNARMFDRMCADPEVETWTDGFPWTGIRERAPFDVPLPPMSSLHRDGVIVLRMAPTRRLPFPKPAKDPTP